jgi:hypothetical protein
MGETMHLSSDTLLRACFPHHCRFTIIHDGQPVHVAEGRELSWRAEQSGKYRVEAELKVRNKWTPWVYTNPMELIGQ